MKKLIIFIVTSFWALSFLCSCIKANDIIIHERCISAANCSICSNCSSCGHSIAGGVCGACSGKVSGKSFYMVSPQNKKKMASNINTISAEPSLYDAPVLYYAKKEIVNIHKGPGFEFSVIEKIRQGSKLVEIEKNGEWLYIKIWKTGTEGFVFYDDVKN